MLPTKAMCSGAVASRAIVTDCALIPPSLVAAQVIATPLVSADTSAGPQPLLEVISLSGSATAQVTATSLVYQPALPSVPDTAGVIVGGVVSTTSTCVSWMAP